MAPHARAQNLARQESILKQASPNASVETTQDIGVAVLQVVCAHATAHLLQEQARLCALQNVLRDHLETAYAGAEALSLVADDRDATRMCITALGRSSA